MKDIVAVHRITEYLIENGSYDVPLSSEDISHHFRDTVDVKRILDEFTDRSMILGVTIRRRANGYYADLPFSETDVVVLRTMLLSLPYCERWQAVELAKRLDAFLPEKKRENNEEVYADLGKYNGTFYENMTSILKALYPANGGIRKLRFEYCEYNDRLELEPRISRYDGTAIRTVDPIKVVCVNNLFYLVVCYYKDGEVKFINYRIDRMKSVECTDVPAMKYEDCLSEQGKYVLALKRSMDKGRREAKAEGRIYHEPNDDATALDEAHRIDSNGFNLREYINKSKIMYTDKMVDVVKVKLDRHSINGMIDLFGFDIDVAPLDEEYVTVYIHNVTETTIVKWAMQFCEAVEVLEPLALRETVRQKVAMLLEKYKGGESNG